MRDRKNSTSPSPLAEFEVPGLPEWEKSAGFRESLLQLFPAREAQVLRQAGQLLFYLATEANMPDPDDSSITRREFEAALVDLRHTQSFLASISRQIDDSALTR